MATSKASDPLGPRPSIMNLLIPVSALLHIVSPIMIYTRLMVKLVLAITNHKVMINQAFECIVLNWQDYSYLNLNDFFGLANGE